MSVETLTIKVHYYHSGGSIMHPHDREPDVHEVDAFVVGGEDGVFAAYWSPEHEGQIDYAQGDDGHWWFAGRYHPHWIPEMAEALTKAAKEPR